MNDFNTREEYKAAVAIWKADYKNLSQRIRDTRLEFCNAQRELSKLGAYDYDWSSDKTKPYWAAHSIVEAARSDRATLKLEATTMINERHAGKKEAQRQYAAART